MTPPASRCPSFFSPTTRPLLLFWLPLHLSKRTGNDVIGLAQTGSGKTGAFAMPILQGLMDKPQELYALVLSPTRELAIQIAEQFEALGSGIGLKTAVLVGGIDMMAQVSSRAVPRGWQGKCRWSGGGALLARPVLESLIDPCGGCCQPSGSTNAVMPAVGAGRLMDEAASSSSGPANQRHLKQPMVGRWLFCEQQALNCIHMEAVQHWLIKPPTACTLSSPPGPVST